MTRAKVVAAKQLIQEEYYDEARAVLRTVKHPAADLWIAKIDALTPHDGTVLTEEPPDEQATVRTKIVAGNDGVFSPIDSRHSTPGAPDTLKTPVGAFSVRLLAVLKTVLNWLQRGIGVVFGICRRAISHIFRKSEAALRKRRDSSGDQIGYYARPEVPRGVPMVMSRHRSIRTTFVFSCLCLVIWLVVISRMFIPAGTPKVADAAPVYVVVKSEAADHRVLPTATLSPEGAFQLKFLDLFNGRIQSVRLIQNRQGGNTIVVIYTTAASTSQELVDEWMMILHPLAQVVSEQGIGVGEVVLLLVDNNFAEIGKFTTMVPDLLSYEAQKISRVDFLKRAKFETFKPTPPPQPALATAAVR